MSPESEPAGPAEGAHGVEPGRQRVHDRAAAPRPAREGGPLECRGGARRHIGKVQCIAARYAVGARDRLLAPLDALPERRRRLIREAVIVLDDVDAAEREAIASLREFGRREAKRLQGGAEPRALA